MPFVVKKTVSGIKPFLVMLLIALLLGWIPIGFASVAVLDFELKDMTVPTTSPPTNTSKVLGNRHSANIPSSLRKPQHRVSVPSPSKCGN